MGLVDDPGTISDGVAAEGERLGAGSTRIHQAGMAAPTIGGVPWNEGNLRRAVPSLPSNENYVYKIVTDWAVKHGVTNDPLKRISGYAATPRFPGDTMKMGNTWRGMTLVAVSATISSPLGQPWFADCSAVPGSRSRCVLWASRLGMSWSSTPGSRGG